MIYYIYAGYYELYVTNKHLNRPFVQVYMAESVNAANAYLTDVDDHIFIDEDLKDYFDEFNGLFNVKNGLPELMED